MRVDGLFLMNEGPKRKCIPVSVLRGSSWLFGEFMSDVGVLHPCTTQENKIKRTIESREEKEEKHEQEERQQQKMGPRRIMCRELLWKCCHIT